MRDILLQPGAPAAVERGCTCERNQVPKPAPAGGFVWRADKDCPLHGLAAVFGRRLPS